MSTSHADPQTPFTPDPAAVSMMSKLLLSTIKQPGLGLKTVPSVLGVLEAVEIGMGRLQQGRGSRSAIGEAFASLTQGAIHAGVVTSLQTNVQ